MELCAGLTDGQTLAVSATRSCLRLLFFLRLHLLAKMKQMPLEIRRQRQFPTRCGGARSGRGAEILPEFHGALAHFRPSHCGWGFCGTGQELGQLSTEATSGSDGEICPDNNKVDNKGDKSAPALT